MAVRISPVRRTITITIYIQVSRVDLESLALYLPAPLQADGVCRGNGVSCCSRDASKSFHVPIPNLNHINAISGSVRLAGSRSICLQPGYISVHYAGFMLWSCITAAAMLRLLEPRCGRLPHIMFQ